MSINVIILAAGAGTRMQSDLPKVLHPLGAVPLVAHALRTAEAMEPARLIVVAGHGAEAVRATIADLSPAAEVVIQTEQRGTGHAVLQARAALDGATGDIIVLYGDTPFVRPETLAKMRDARARNAVVVLGFHAADPGRYGRLVMQDDSLERIVEFKDADDATRAIDLCNSGVVCADAATLFSLLDAVTDDNAAQEFYLTDIVAIARARGLCATAVTCAEGETLGINSRAELAAAEARFQAQARADALAAGVTLTAPDTVFFAQDTVIGRDTVIDPQVVFGPGVTVESGAHIRAFSHLEGCHVSRGAVVGPFARLRPGAELAEDVHIGNFVEVKNAILDEGVKVNHLSYIGDADIGARTNIGAGTITCNYDGVFKHRTRIGREVFVGSNTMLVAPVALGDQAMTASGSVITRDVAPGDLGIARARQDNRAGFARRFMDRLRALGSSRQAKE